MNFINESKKDIFLRKDFDKHGTPSRVTRAISALLKEGKIVRLGYGIYAKSFPSLISKKPIPRKPLEILAKEIFQKLEVPITLGKSRSNYLSGKTDQIPNVVTLSTGKKRFARKISLGGRMVVYEKNNKGRN